MQVERGDHLLRCACMRAKDWMSVAAARMRSSRCRCCQPRTCLHWDVEGLCAWITFHVMPAIMMQGQGQMQVGKIDQPSFLRGQSFKHPSILVCPNRSRHASVSFGNGVKRSNSEQTFE